MRIPKPSIGFALSRAIPTRPPAIDAKTWLQSRGGIGSRLKIPSTKLTIVNDTRIAHRGSRTVVEAETVIGRRRTTTRKRTPITQRSRFETGPAPETTRLAFRGLGVRERLTGVGLAQPNMKWPAPMKKRIGKRNVPIGSMWRSGLR